MACIHIFGQNVSQGVPNVIPPTPTSASFQKYGNYPVSLYTGVADISVPIYDLSFFDFNLPINLRYHSSGIKVDEESGPVGLGWILDCGGVITHTIKGRYNDFYEDVYFNNRGNNRLKDFTGLYTFSKYTFGTAGKELPFSLISGLSKYDIYKAFGEDVDCGGIEFAPDEFEYHFLGHSNKFIFDRQGKIIKQNEDNIKIIPYTDNNGLLVAWDLIDDFGNIYKFAETAKTVIPSKPSIQATYNSSFYLTEIRTVAGAIIDFEYKKNSIYTTRFLRLDDSMITNSQLSFEEVKYETVYLDKISCSQLGIEIDIVNVFDRIDLKGEPRISKIKLSRGNSILNEWNFLHDYFSANLTTTENPTLGRIAQLTNIGNTIYNADWNNKRLKLLGLEKKFSTGDQVEKYGFEYLEDKLPTKLSLSRDHWGYFNGVNNNTLIPTISENISKDPSQIEIVSNGRGADRNPSEGHSTAFLLRKIIYPTKGNTVFQYESNRYKTNDFENDESKRNLMYSMQETLLEEGVGWNNVPISYVHEQDFSIPFSSISTSSPINIKVEIELDDRYNSGNISGLFLNISIVDKLTGNIAWNFIYQAPHAPTSVNDQNRLFSRIWNNVQLSSDKNYVIKVSGSMRSYIRNTEVRVTRYVAPEEHLQNNFFGLGGGVRILSVKSYDINQSFISGKKYQYTTPFVPNIDVYTSGRLLSYPRYRKDYMTIGSNGLKDNSYSVGYSVVREYEVDPTDNFLGRVDYHYHNSPDINLDYSWFDLRPNSIFSFNENPDGVSSYKNSENGDILKKEIYKSILSNFSRVHEEVYEYSYFGGGPHIIWGAIKSDVFIPQNSNSGCLTPEAWNLVLNYPDQSNRASAYLYPAIVPKQKFLNKVISTSFSEDYSNLNSITTVKEMDYNLKNGLIMEFRESVGDTGFKKVKYKYPFDFEIPVYKKMVDKNMIQNLINTEVERGDGSYQIKNDFIDNNDMPVLFRNSVKYSNGLEYNVNLEIEKFDKKNRPLQIKKQEAPVTVYLWGYGGQYPIAKIENASYSDVLGVLGQAAITSLEALNVPESTINTHIQNLRNTLTKSQVTTYTYSPLTGMKSMTNPRGQTEYYEYDGFQRLKEVLDFERNVLTDYQYHYKP